MTSFEEWWKKNAYFHGSVDEEYKTRMERMFKQAYAAGAASRDEECLKRYSQGYDDGAAAMRERCAEAVWAMVEKKEHRCCMLVHDAIRKMEV